MDIFTSQEDIEYTNQNMVKQRVSKKLEKRKVNLIKKRSLGEGAFMYYAGAQGHSFENKCKGEDIFEQDSTPQKYIRHLFDRIEEIQQKQYAKVVKQQDSEINFSQQESFYNPHKDRYYKQLQKPILSSNDYINLSQVDFRILCDSISRSKIYAAMLIDQWGKIIYSDKLGHELFQGSLNSFTTLKIQNILLKTLKQSYLRQLECRKSLRTNNIFNWIIYSKNTKRRYCRVPILKSENSLDIFYRFLKCLTLRIRPVRLFLENYKGIQGFWNPTLVQDGEAKTCFFVQVCLCNKTPNISKQTLQNDPQLQKYIKANNIKAEKWALEVSRRAKEPKIQSEEQSEIEESNAYQRSHHEVNQSSLSELQVKIQHSPITQHETKGQKQSKPLLAEVDIEAYLSLMKESDRPKGVNFFSEVFYEDC